MKYTEKELESMKEEKLEKEMKSFLKMSIVYGVIGFFIGLISSSCGILGRYIEPFGHDVGSILLPAFLQTVEFIGFTVVLLIVMFCMIKFKIIPLIMFNKRWEKEKEELTREEQSKWVYFK